MADKPTSQAALQQIRPFSIYQEHPTQFMSSSSSQFPSTPAKQPQDSSSSTSMANTMATEPKKPLDISNLMSPPELPPFDTFSQSSPMRRSASDHRAILPPLSPPISPFTKASNTIDPVPSVTLAIKDPILYPSSELSSSPPEPLFRSKEPLYEARRVVDEHVAARPPSLFILSSPPKREHYELALFFKSAVMQKFLNNPRGWLRKERELLARDRKNGVGRVPSKLATILPAKISPLRPQSLKLGSNRVVKPRSQQSRPRQPTSAQIGSQPPRLIRASLPNGGPVRSAIRVSTTPDEPRIRTVAPNREDKDFSSLPDYSPPLGSLPSRPNSLRVDWKGNPLDLGNDPFAHLLHPDEISLAAGLRLDCATYLTSKRRIFIKRLECAQIPKEFRKTDAQQACKIDVNKASKLWTAYEKVGWLHIDWIKKWM